MKFLRKEMHQEHQTRDVKNLPVKEKQSKAMQKLKILKQQKVFDSTNDMYRSLSDLHWLLKLSKTLDVIKNYQNKNLPDTATLKQTMIELNNAIKKTDSLLKEMQHQRSQMHKE